MAQKDKGSHRTMIIGGLVLLVVGGAIAWWLLRPGSQASGDFVPTRGPDSESRTRVEGQPKGPLKGPPGGGPPVRRQPGNLLSRVEVNKVEVCLGEPLELRADPVEGSDELTVEVVHDGRASLGNPAVFQFREPGTKNIEVQASNRDGESDIRQVEVQARRCDDQQGFLSVDVLGARPERPRLVALPMEWREVEVRRYPEPPPGVTPPPDAGPPTEMVEKFVPVEHPESYSYEWEFGDGTSESTDSPLAEHDYSHRLGNKAQHTYVVRVTATSPDGAKMRGATTVSFIDDLFRQRRDTGRSRLYAEVLDPVAHHSGDARSARVFVRNPWDEPVDIENAEISFSPCDGEGAESETFTTPASDVLTKTRLGPGASEKLSVSIPSAMLGSDACTVGVRLERGGEMVASFPLQLRERSIEERFRIDPDGPQSEELKQDIARAQEILGEDATVRPEDLSRLQRLGMLD